MHAYYLKKILLIAIRGEGNRERRKIKKAFPFGSGLLGGDEWIRTTDSRIFSPMLYQLSYITVKVGAKLVI